MVALLKLARLQSGLDFDGNARITQIDAPSNPKVAQFFGVTLHSGRRIVPTLKEACLSEERLSIASVPARSRTNFAPGVTPVEPYFNAFKRAERRDLYREAVFWCNTPFWIALSSADTVSR